MLPKLFRVVAKELEGSSNYYSREPGFSNLASMLTQFLDSELTLHKTAATGVGEFEDYFLGFKLKDEELPWDINQEDW